LIDWVLHWLGYVADCFFRQLTTGAKKALMTTDLMWDFDGRIYAHVFGRILLATAAGLIDGRD
jgi:hypothetical protein